MKKLFFLFLLLIPAISVAQKNVDAREIIDKINRGEAVTCRDATITGKLDFTALSNRSLKPEKAFASWAGGAKTYISTVNVPLQFTNCTFTDDVLAYYSLDKEDDEGGDEVYKADFEGNVLFERCTFQGQSAFKYSVFDKNVSFAGSRFNNEALFKYTLFKTSPDFSKVEFMGEANFKYTRFKQEVNFSGAAFRRTAIFKYTGIPAGSSFRNTLFAGLADFKYAKFSQPVDLKDVAFNGGEDFKHTKINGDSFTDYLDYSRSSKK